MKDHLPQSNLFVLSIVDDVLPYMNRDLVYWDMAAAACKCIVGGGPRDRSLIPATQQQHQIIN